ncbi:MAG: hypothetical protein JWM93_2812 [Frankiales bacterium]|nr:hypothetical protein [Frankiales bacterium]
MTATGDSMVTVQLVGLPLKVHARAQQHADEMTREFQLIVEQDHQHAGSVPDRLLQLSTMLSSRYAGFTAEQERRIEAGIAAGEVQLDTVTFTVPADVGTAARQFGDILDEADEYCRTGQLLTLAPSPEVAAYRRWYLDNFIVQCAGAPPQPWSGPLG